MNKTRIISFVKPNYFEICFVLVAIIFGIIFSFIWGPGYIYDEAGHYRNSYILADRIMGKPVDVFSEDYLGVKGMHPVSFSARICDEDFLSNEAQEEPITLSNSTFFNEESGEVMVENFVYSYFPFPTYIVDSIGIIIGRVIFNFGPVTLLYFIRFINLAIYIAVGLLCMRILPSYKEFIFVLFLLPSCLPRGVSAGHESLYFAYTWFYVFYVISLAFREDKINSRELCVLFMSSILIAPIKGIGIMFVGLVLLIKKKAFSTSRKYYGYLGCIIVMSVVLWIAYNITSIDISDVISNANGIRNIEYSNTEAIYLTDFIYHPLWTIKMLYNTIETQFVALFRKVTDTILWESYGDLVAEGFLLLMMIAVPSKEGDEIILSIKEKIWCFVVLLAEFSLLCVTTFISWGGSQRTTPPLKPTYLLPYLPFIILLLRGRIFIYVGRYRKLGIIVGCVSLHIVGILNVWERLLTVGR